MAASCLIKNSEYRTKLKQSGISELIFYAVANDFVQKHGRFPNLDEIPGSDSSQHIIESLNIKEDNSTKVEKILSITGTDNIEDANVALNDKYSDLEVRVMKLNEEAIVDIENRPSDSLQRPKQEVNIPEKINGTVMFNQIFDKLRTLYGINLIPITNRELNKMNIPDAQFASAFVHDGNIYINTDLADVDAPIHEMTHILLGSIRFKNPDLYFKIIQNADQFKSFKDLKDQNLNRAHSDLLEEAFVEEVSKYLSGMESDIDALGELVKYEINYNIKRLLDSVLMGQYSVKSIPDEKLYNMTFSEIAKVINSAQLNESGISSLEDAQLHRILANTRGDLMKTGDIQEACE